MLHLICSARIYNILTTKHTHSEFVMTGVSSLISVIRMVTVAVLVSDRVSVASTVNT